MFLILILFSTFDFNPKKQQAVLVLEGCRQDL